MSSGLKAKAPMKAKVTVYFEASNPTISNMLVKGNT